MDSRRAVIRSVCGLVAALATLTLAGSLAAQGPMDTVQIHGFGGWAYGKTDGSNTYVFGTEDGRYDNADFALNISAEPLDNLSIVAQLRGEAVAGEDNFELDYAFANYAFSDAFNIRLGRVKHPFGIYGEIFDVGTLRPFFFLPQGIYGPYGNTARAYNGVGILGAFDLGAAWELKYDLYGGQTDGKNNYPGFLVQDAPELLLEPKIEDEFRINDAIGTRLTLVTPIEGLRIGLSAYTGMDDTETGTLEEESRRTVYLASFEYTDARLWLRAEWSNIENGEVYETDGGYVEAAYKLDSHWQPAVRWDTRDFTIPSLDPAYLPAFYRQRLEHEELAMGINYWLGASLVVRLSYHQVDGNAYTYLETPEQVMEMLATDQLDKRTDLIVFGAQFSF